MNPIELGHSDLMPPDDPWEFDDHIQFLIFTGQVPESEKQ
jgi:hypothetical protein